MLGGIPSLSVLMVGSTAFIMVAVSAAAQSPLDDAIEPDRPGQATSTTVISPGSVQMESGYRVSSQRDETRFDLGELDLRWGLASRAELRVSVNSFSVIERSGKETSQGFDDPSIGLKLAVGGLQRGAVPQMALIVGAGLPIGGQGIGAEKVTPSVTWAGDWTLTPAFALTGNLGYAWSEDDGQRFSQVTAALSLGVSFWTRWGSFVEVYGHNQVTKDGPAVGVVDVGITYLLTRTLQLDAHVGHGLQRVGPERWAGVGLSYRF